MKSGAVAGLWEWRPDRGEQHGLRHSSSFVLRMSEQRSATIAGAESIDCEWNTGPLLACPGPGTMVPIPFLMGLTGGC